MIPFRKRGMYQALQNGMFGFGAICGASFGGSIADSIGWYVQDSPIGSVAADQFQEVVFPITSAHICGSSVPWMAGC